MLEQQPEQIAPIHYLLFGAGDQLDPWFPGLHQAPIGGKIFERHAARSKTFLEMLADLRPAQL
jgi:hypothetical protein